MKKIIYATDYSDNSVAALKYAINIGKMLGTDVIALHVYKPSEEGDKMECRKNHQEKLREFCQENLQEQFSASEISFAAVKGSNIPHTILEFVRDLNVEMIVMGTGETGTIRDVLLGSTTKEMTQISHFPILAIPPDQTPGKMEKILFASTLQEEDLANLLEVTRMFSPVDPEITVVHITQKENEAAQNVLEEFRQKAEKKVTYKKLRFKNIHSSQVYETLQKSIAENRPDVVVISECPKASEMSKVIKREKVKKMQSYTRVPILTIPVVV